MRQAPEQWQVDAGDADVATLHVPPALGRVRRFDVDVRFEVQCPVDAQGAWHGMSVEIDGRQVWSRQIATHNAGQTDSLDYHQRIDVAESAALRVRAVTRVGGAQRRRLRIEAAEEA